MEDINLKNDPYRENILDKLEYVFAILFTIEMLLKVTGLGLTRYFTSLWCWLDFGIVVVSSSRYTQLLVNAWCCCR